MHHRQSHTAFERASRRIPGGVNSPARAFGAVGGEPIFFAKGEGSRLVDIDGNEFIDYVGSWGPLILGHAHPAVVEAVQSAATKGTSFGSPTEAETELAELIAGAFPTIEKVRLVNSGTEATMSALRLARACTGRDKIVKFAGNYHGHVDSLLVAAGSSAATLAVPNSPGIPDGATGDTIILPYNDVGALEAIFAERGRSIAAVIFEPVAGNMGVVPPTDAFLHALRRQTREHGALLICDEVMTGFRVAFGGAQQLYGIEPDLTTLGKIVGGGLPVGAYGGRADLMDCVLPVGKVFQAGTLSGNPLATAAGIATLRWLRDNPTYDRLETLGARLEGGLRAAALSAEVPHSIARVGSMMTLFFHDGPITNWDAASHCDNARYARWFWAMLERGIYLPCSQYESLFISAAHTEHEIDAMIQAARDAMAKLWCVHDS